jgi:hypothetical protein
LVRSAVKLAKENFQKTKQNCGVIRFSLELNKKIQSILYIFTAVQHAPLHFVERSKACRAKVSFVSKQKCKGSKRLAVGKQNTLCSENLKKVGWLFEN